MVMCTYLLHFLKSAAVYDLSKRISSHVLETGFYRLWDDRLGGCGVCWWEVWWEIGGLRGRGWAGLGVVSGI